MTRDAWDKRQEQRSTEEESGDVRDVEKMKVGAKVNKSIGKSPMWDDFVGEVGEDTQPWTPVTTEPRSPDQNV